MENIGVVLLQSQGQEKRNLKQHHQMFNQNNNKLEE